MKPSYISNEMIQFVAHLDVSKYMKLKKTKNFKFFRIFFKISYIFDTSKYAANYIISFEVYDGFIGQKI